MSAIPPGTTETATPSGACPACQSPVFEDERFCEVCGTRVVAEPEVPAEVDGGLPPEANQRLALDLGAVAAITDRGWRRPRNEDAFAIAAHGERTAVAVCDGVASTANPHLASQVAVAAALTVLEPALESPDWPGPVAVAELLTRAFGAAQHAVAAVPDDEPDANDLSPSTTMVLSFAGPGRLAVGSVGDSRAYWLDGAGAGRVLTVDDSWAEERIAEGIDAALAYADPGAHTITRWLGADAESFDPAVTLLDVSEPGTLVVCTDGMWNYFDQPEQLAAIAAEGTDPTPLEVARRLVDAALDAGGHDNVTVAVIPVGPSFTPTTPSASHEE